MIKMQKPLFFKKKGITPYITLADPSLDFTEKFLIQLYKEDLAAIEIGLPFSDPIADGPVIQASHHRALKKNPSLSIDDAFQLLLNTKSFKTTPIIFMSAVNLILNYGVEKFFKKAQQLQLDAVILPDLNPEFAEDYINFAKQYNVALVFLVSPLVTSQRLQKIVSVSHGFVYLISRVGVTGEQGELAKNLDKHVTAIKSIKKIDVGLGFGISTHDQVDYVLKLADSAIVGSFLVKKIETAQKENKSDEEIISSAIQALRSLRNG